MNATDFYAGDRFGLFIYLRSMRDSNLHENGLRLVNTKEGVQLAINGNASSSGNIKCHIFIPQTIILVWFDRPGECSPKKDCCRYW